MKSIEVEWFQSKYSLSEISQGSGFLFSLLSAPRDGSKQVHQYVRCRDFLHDAIRSHITGKTTEIYGFGYRKGTDPVIDMRRTRVLVSKTESSKTNPNDSRYEMYCGLKIVNYFESIMGVRPTKLQKVSNSTSPAWVFNGNGVWMKSPTLISMYTLLIRLGYQKIKIDTYDNFIKEVYAKNTQNCDRPNDRDSGYVEKIGNNLLTVAKNYKHIFDIKPGRLGSSYDPIYRDDVTIDVFHNSSGILSLCDGRHKNVLKASDRLFTLLEKEKVVNT